MAVMASCPPVYVLCCFGKDENFFVARNIIEVLRGKGLNLIQLEETDIVSGKDVSFYLQGVVLAFISEAFLDNFRERDIRKSRVKRAQLIYYASLQDVLIPICMSHRTDVSQLPKAAVNHYLIDVLSRRPLLDFTEIHHLEMSTGFLRAIKARLARSYLRHLRSGPNPPQVVADACFQLHFDEDITYIFDSIQHLSADFSLKYTGPPPFAQDTVQTPQFVAQDLPEPFMSIPFDVASYFAVQADLEPSALGSVDVAGLLREMRRVDQYVFKESRSSTIIGFEPRVYGETAKILMRMKDPCLRAYGMWATARSHPDDEKLTGPQGRELDRALVVLAALATDPNLSMGYYFLANDLDGKAMQLLPDGRVMGKYELFVEAIRCDPEFVYSYNNLSNCMRDYEVALLRDGRMLSIKLLFADAIRQYPTYLYAIDNLGDHMAREEVISLPVYGVCTKRDLFLHAIRIDPSFHSPYLNLANALDDDDSITLPDGREYTKRDLFVEAMRRNKDLGCAYNNLAVMMESRQETITLPDGRPVNRRDLYAISYFDFNIHEAAVNLAADMSRSEIMYHDGRAYNASELLALGCEDPHVVERAAEYRLHHSRFRHYTAHRARRDARHAKYDVS